MPADDMACEREQAPVVMPGKFGGDIDRERQDQQAAIPLRAFEQQRYHRQRITAREVIGRLPFESL